MPSSIELRNQADTADQLAQVISYAKDKSRMKAQAVDLRRRADEMDRKPPAPAL
jgi:hypothetical protein